MHSVFVHYPHCTVPASSKLITPLPQPFSFILQSFSPSFASSCHTLLNRCTCTHLALVLPSSPASCAFFSEEEAEEAEAMVRGGSSGGGQSSLGYLFGSDAGPPKAVARAPAAAAPTPAPVEQRAAGFARSNAPEEKQPAAAAGGAPAQQKVEDAGTSLDMGAAKLGRNSNNYHRADGQNNGNFITDRPSTKVHAAPGGGSSLGYLFGGS